MKTLLLSLFTSASLMACDAPKAISGSTTPLVITLAPGVPHVETWDFTDCGFGITSDSFYVTQPRSRNGVIKNLPANTPLTVTLYDVTTGQYYAGAFTFYGINNFQSVCGHVLQMTLTVAATSRKNVQVEITQAANWGGPCQ